MMRSVLPFLMRVICLILVVATGVSGVAYADHGGSHGSHCITSAQLEKSAPHDHEEHADAASHHEAEGQSCLQHSCIAVFNALILSGQPQRLVVADTRPHGDLVRASANPESLHRPPIA